jgi:hypothetical protein
MYRLALHDANVLWCSKDKRTRRRAVSKVRQTTPARIHVLNSGPVPIRAFPGRGRSGTTVSRLRLMLFTAHVLGFPLFTSRPVPRSGDREMFCSLRLLCQ